MDEARDENQFVADEVSRVIREAVDYTLGGHSYNSDLVRSWTKQVVDTTLSMLTKEQKPYKYVCNAMIMQKVGAGLHTASSCFWNNDTDGGVTVRWENKTMYCVVSVFGLAV